MQLGLKEDVCARRGYQAPGEVFTFHRCNCFSLPLIPASGRHTSLQIWPNEWGGAQLSSLDKPTYTLQGSVICIDTWTNTITTTKYFSCFANEISVKLIGSVALKVNTGTT